MNRCSPEGVIVCYPKGERWGERLGATVGMNSCSFSSSKVGGERRSDFAAKRVYITAQGFNPGSGGLVKGALKVAPDVGRGDGITREQPKDAPRPPLFLLRPAFPKLWRTSRADFALRITQG
jgi:hypothetical protein